MIFMLIYYKGAGLVADIALVLNFFFMIAILSAFNLTLTLTSIAGLILTVGMAVDANVIIFERIKEEYRLGKTVQASVKAGFSKAFWTVMDAKPNNPDCSPIPFSNWNRTSTGLCIHPCSRNCILNVTALFVSRLIFDFGIQQLNIKKLSIGWGIK